jgi:hypothetical protein
MSAWGALAGGLVGTVLLTTILRAASELRLTRMDLPFLLGTMFTADRARAKALGYLLHFIAGLAFAMAYYAVFRATGRGGVVAGAVLGLLHGLFAATTLVNVVLPLLHPRLGTDDTSAERGALLEPPGFMMRNYGARTPLVSTVAHTLYGGVVGGFGGLT